MTNSLTKGDGKANEALLHGRWYVAVVTGTRVKSIQEQMFHVNAANSCYSYVSLAGRRADFAPAGVRNFSLVSHVIMIEWQRIAATVVA
jgi:hypothetical protein